MKPRIAITGPDGLVGSRIIELLEDEFTFIPLLRADMDITDWDSVQRTFEDIDCDIILHLAAYTNVDGAETERELAHKINVEGTANILKVATAKQVKMIQISTDFVFDGTNPPYDESSKPNPTGYYGQTKLEAEQLLHKDPETQSQELKENAMIVRITYPYRLDDYKPRPDMIRGIRDALKNGRSIAGITDAIITPTFIDDIAYALEHLMNNFSNEIYHVVGDESLSPHDVFELIANHWDLDTGLITTTTYDEFFAGKAPRPKLGRTISRKNTFHPMRGITEILQSP